MQDGQQFNNSCGLIHSRYISVTAIQGELQVLQLAAIPMNLCFGNVMEIAGVLLPMHDTHISCVSIEDLYLST